jgi:DNA-binding transcriptional MerR regulator
MPQFIPGSTLEYSKSEGMFATLRPLIRATNGLTLSQVCAITGLEGSTIQNWVKRGFVANPVNKKYFERQLARILLISALREAMPLDTIGELTQMINGSANDESDDIISEEDLYDCFCSVISGGAGQILSFEEIPRLVKNAVKNYNPPHEKAYETLTEALEVMAYAHTSAEYKKLAKSKLENMK